MIQVKNYVQVLKCIDEKMQEQEVTQTVMAQDLEVKQPYLNRVLNRKTMPSIEFVFKVLNYLNIKVAISN